MAELFRVIFILLYALITCLNILNDDVTSFLVRDAQCPSQQVKAKLSSKYFLNPRRAGVRRHLRSAGGGGRLDAPLLTRLLRIVEENGKKRSKARQKALRNYFSSCFGSGQN